MSIVSINTGTMLTYIPDTDSIHCLLGEDDLEDLSKFLDIDDYRLGAWKMESTFTRGKYLRQKCYIEEDYNGKINVTVAGLPKFMSKYITFENFKEGLSILGTDTSYDKHKLTFTHTKGGVVLTPTDFTIKG